MAVLFLLVAVLGCSSADAGRGGEDAQRRPGAGGMQPPGQPGGMAQAVPVEAGIPWRADLSSYVFGNAHLEALREVEVVARVEGMLDRLNVEEGREVRPGQVLAELDKSALGIALREAQASYDNAGDTYGRAKQMLEKDLTSQAEVDRLEYEFKTAQTRLERAQLNLRYATITAPFGGIITRRLVEKGDMIRTGTVLFQLAEIGKLRARVFVPEKEMGRIRIDSPVRIQSEMFPERTFAGRVEMLAPVVDPTTGTLKVTVEVGPGQPELRAGMFCSVFIHVATHENVAAISRRALIPDAESPEVFVIDDSSMVHRRRVTIGLAQGDTLELLGGLAEGERMVLMGQESLHEGTRVLIAGEEAPEAGVAPDSAAAEPGNQPPGGGGNRRARTE